MATNREVAERIASVITPHLKGATNPVPLVRPLQGSNLRADSKNDRTRHLTHHSNGLFISLADGISYRTNIAEIVYNTHAQVPELWIVPQKYSSTTGRHKSYITQAFVSQMVDAGFAPTRVEAYEHIYQTNAMQNLTLCRVSQAIADQSNTWSAECTTTHHINRTMKSIDDKGIHDASRYVRVHRARLQAEYLLNIISKDVPDGYGGLSAVTLRQQLDDLLGFLQSLATIDDTSKNCHALRTAVRGWIELEREVR